MTGIAWYIPSAKFDVMTTINEQNKPELRMFNLTAKQEYNHKLIMFSADCAEPYNDTFIDEVLPTLGIES